MLQSLSNAKCSLVTLQQMGTACDLLTQLLLLYVANVRQNLLMYTFDFIWMTRPLVF